MIDDRVNMNSFEREDLEDGAEFVLWDTLYISYFFSLRYPFLLLMHFEYDLCILPVGVVQVT